jgi:hypothetical protein
MAKVNQHTCCFWPDASNQFIKVGQSIKVLGRYVRLPMFCERQTVQRDLDRETTAQLLMNPLIC